MRIYSTQLNRGENYSQIKKVTQINFVDNVKIKINEKVISEHYLISKELSDDFEIDIVRLDLENKKYYNLSDRFRKQLKFLSAKSYEERESIAKGDEILMDLNTWLEEYKNDESLREFFDERRWAELKGHNQGIEQGIEQEKIEIAKKMLLETSNLEFISRTTDLSLEKIKELQKETTEK